jgi:hypothetical protein
MKFHAWFFAASAALAGLALAQSSNNPLAGRWDLNITSPTGTIPGWIEYVEKDGAPSVRYQPRSGTVYAVRNAKVEAGHLLLPIGRATWDLTAQGNKITGVIKNADATQGQVTGVRAPELKRAPPKAWGNPEPLFNGKDLTGWEPDNPARSHWIAKDGELVNEQSGANLRTTRKFDDFKLHIEFNCPDGGNSGVYLRGRYEIQVEYEPLTQNDEFHRIGAIYGFIKPAAELPRKPGTWENYDVTLVGRYLTVVRNGVKTIDNQEIPGITGGALDSDEAAPGAFYIQGDHTGGLRYRNITVSVPK